MSITISTESVMYPEDAQEHRALWLNHEEAATAIANVMMRFSAEVANQQGACDKGTMNNMISDAVARYEYACG